MRLIVCVCLLMNRDIMQRTNHLQQCASYLSTALPSNTVREKCLRKTPAIPSSANPDGSGPSKVEEGATAKARSKHAKRVSRQLASQMKDVSKKAVMRLCVFVFCLSYLLRLGAGFQLTDGFSWHTEIQS